MFITQLTRWKCGNAEEIAKAAKQAKVIFGKHGAEWLRLSRFHSGPYAGEWLVATRYSGWGAYGKAQEALAKDADFAKLMAHMNGIAEMTGRSVTTGMDI
jgi:hypothetical protein